MSLPNYVTPGQSYITPEMAASSNAANAAVINPTGVNLTSQLVGNLSGALHGELPDDVKQLIQQQAAQNGVASGTGGSDFANYQGLRTLGLTSLSRMQHAEDSLVNPLLGYHPPYVNPNQPAQPGFTPPQGTGGFGNTTPHYNVGPIGPTGGGGAHPTLPTYGAPAGETSTGNILNDLLSKYGPIGNSGASPMGGYGGPALTPSPFAWPNQSVAWPNQAITGSWEDQGYGYGNTQDAAPPTRSAGYDEDYAAAMREDQANLASDLSYANGG